MINLLHYIDCSTVILITRGLPPAEGEVSQLMLLSFTA